MVITFANISERITYACYNVLAKHSSIKMDEEVARANVNCMKLWHSDDIDDIQ